MASGKNIDEQIKDINKSKDAIKTAITNTGVTVNANAKLADMPERITAMATGQIVDAGKLQGRDSNYYLNYNNLSNKPTIPSLSGYATQTWVQNTARAHQAEDINFIPARTGIPQAAYSLWPSARANRLSFLPADQILIEESIDGGKTWKDSIISDSTKTGLFSQTRPSIRIPLKDKKKSCDCMIRITFTAIKFKNVPQHGTCAEKFAAWTKGHTETRTKPSGEQYNVWVSDNYGSSERYCSLDGIFLWLSSNSDRIKCSVYKSTGVSPNNWTLEREGFCTGWSGSNFLKLTDGNFGGGSTQTSNYWFRRIIFRTAAPATYKDSTSKDPKPTPDPLDDKYLSTSYTNSAQVINEITAYGLNVWTPANNLMNTDRLYKWDIAQNASFPASLNVKQEIESQKKVIISHNTFEDIDSLVTTYTDNEKHIPNGETIDNDLSKFDHKTYNLATLTNSYGNWYTLLATKENPSIDPNLLRQYWPYARHTDFVLKTVSQKASADGHTIYTPEADEIIKLSSLGSISLLTEGISSVDDQGMLNPNLTDHASFPSVEISNLTRYTNGVGMNTPRIFIKNNHTLDMAKPNTGLLLEGYMLKHRYSTLVYNPKEKSKWTSFSELNEQLPNEKLLTNFELNLEDAECKMHYYNWMVNTSQLTELPMSLHFNSHDASIKAYHIDINHGDSITYKNHFNSIDLNGQLNYLKFFNQNNTNTILLNGNTGEIKSENLTVNHDIIEGTQTLANKYQAKGNYLTTAKASAGAHINQPGTPSISVSTENGTSTFTFDYLKGEQGIQGPQGPQGFRGAQGLVGPQGTPGQAATIKIGTTTTGAEGSKATVINVGNSQQAIFNFTIPKGDKGDTGAQGVPGPQGPQGFRGERGPQGPGGLTTTDATTLETHPASDFVLKAGSTVTGELYMTRGSQNEAPISFPALNNLKHPVMGSRDANNFVIFRGNDLHATDKKSASLAVGATGLGLYWNAELLATQPWVNSKNYLSKTITTDQSIASNITCQKNVTINGNMTISGTTTTLNTETVSTKDNIIDLASGRSATTGIAGPVGLQVKNYKGTEKTGQLVFKNDGMAYVGNSDNLQPLATRNALNAMTNNKLVKWNGTLNRLETDDTDYLPKMSQAADSAKLEGTSKADLIASINTGDTATVQGTTVTFKPTVNNNGTIVANNGQLVEKPLKTLSINGVNYGVSGKGEINQITGFFKEGKIEITFDSYHNANEFYIVTQGHEYNSCFYAQVLSFSLNGDVVTSGVNSLENGQSMVCLRGFLTKNRSIKFWFVNVSDGTDNNTIDIPFTIYYR